jgi:hypothetical protein
MKRSEIKRRSEGGRAPERRSPPPPNSAVRALVHDVVNSVAAIQISVSTLRARATLTKRETTDIGRIEAAAGALIRLVTNLPPSLGRRPRALDVPAVGDSLDLYILCCEIAQLRRVADGTVIHCRAFGDPRGDWDRRQIAKLLSGVLDHTIAHLGNKTPLTISVTGMARHVRVNVHGLGWPSAGKQQTSLHVSSRLGDAPPGTVISATASPQGGIVFTLRLPRRSAIPSVNVGK